MTAGTFISAFVSLLFLSACGSGGPGSTTGSANGLLALAQCMHSHGVSNFPDPVRAPGTET